MADFFPPGGEQEIDDYIIIYLNICVWDDNWSRETLSTILSFGQTDFLHLSFPFYSTFSLLIVSLITSVAVCQ